MNHNNFEIKILDLHWINDIDDGTDLCAHGHIFLKIGAEIISDQNSLDVAVRSTALYLMRTLKSSYKKDDYASQLLPCCGHFIMVDEEKDIVEITGCNIGIDWTIEHLDNGDIKHISESGQEAIISKEVYKEIVFNFADQVENFYNTSLPRKIPTDDFDKKGYLAFWKEWRNLRNE